MDLSQQLNLAETFVSSLHNDLASLHTAMDNADTATLKRLLHTFKGYITFLCNEALADQLIRLEASARELTAEQLHPDLSDLLSSLTAMHHEVAHWRDHLLQQQT